MQPCLETKELEIGYAGRAILPPISLRVHRGEFWGVAGSNGSGKSTLLRSILGLIPTLGGTTTWSDAVRVGYVPQRVSLDLTMPARAIDVEERFTGGPFSIPCTPISKQRRWPVSCVKRAQRRLLVSSSAS